MEGLPLALLVPSVIISCTAQPGGARRPDLFDAGAAVVRFATLLTSHPGAVEQRDLDELGAQLSTEKVFELVVAIATANWTNRFNDGLGLRSADRAAGGDPRIPALSSP